MIRYAIKKNIWCYSKFGETIPSSKLTHVFLQKSCMFLVIESSLSPKFWRILRGHSATPEQSTLNPQDCRNKLMDSTVLDRLFLKICLPSIKRIICVFFQEHILFLRFGQIVSRYTSKVTHWSNYPKIKEFLGMSAFLKPCQMAHFLLDPSHPTNGAAKLLKTEPWKCNRLFIEFENGEYNTIPS